jgi:thiosulfate/3-mercaptopyruvate sulfurtransferase
MLIPLADCLAVHGQPDVVFIDGSWFIMNRNGRAEYEQGPRIAGAKYFDIDDIAVKGDSNPKNLPHMLPSKQLFAAAMDAMEITNDQHLIVYVSKGCVSIFHIIISTELRPSQISWMVF